MTRVVADTNVLVSAVIANGKPREFLRRCIAKEWRLVTSPPLLAEYVDVLRALSALVEVAEVVEPKRPVRVVIDDPDDDRVVEAAFEGAADFIVSGDRHLLR